MADENEVKALAERMRNAWLFSNGYADEVFLDAAREALRWRDETRPQQPAALADAEEDAYVIERMGKLLAEIAIIVNGTEPHDTLWSYHDLPDKVRALKQAQQPAAAVPASACPHSTRCHCIGVCKYGTAVAGAQPESPWLALAGLVEEVDASFDTAESRAYVEFYPVGPVDRLIAACRELIKAQQPAAAVPDWAGHVKAAVGIINAAKSRPFTVSEKAELLMLASMLAAANKGNAND